MKGKSLFGRAALSMLLAPVVLAGGNPAQAKEWKFPSEVPPRNDIKIENRVGWRAPTSPTACGRSDPRSASGILVINP